MILIFEMTWTGTVHAPVNCGVIQFVARAWPEQHVRVHADPTHLAELQRDPALTALPNIAFVPIEVSQRYRGRTHMVSFPRFWREFRTIRTALGKVPRKAGCLVLLTSTTATGTFAAAYAASLSGRRMGIQIGLHGNLSDATGWRPRNPLVRAFDTRSALQARFRAPVRFLVLEPAIRTALQSTLPAAAARTDVVRHPINAAEISTSDPPVPSPPIRIGFVGLGSEAKGFPTFLDIAARVKARHGDRVAFVHVGIVQAGKTAGCDVLEDPPAHEHLSRAEFARRLAALHYVFLPFRRGYYDFSASGALIDAVTWLKPIITMRVPLSEQFFAESGEIGFICEDEAGMEAAVEGVLTEVNPERYARQIDALRGAREARRTEVLAECYREAVQLGFPRLLEQPVRPAAGRPE
jgi:glycosyltransferase involved in cell wall biosynthesis